METKKKTKPKLDICPDCNGRGFIELEAGLIVKPCTTCNKTKEE